MNFFKMASHLEEREKKALDWLKSDAGKASGWTELRLSSRTNFFVPDGFRSKNATEITNPAVLELLKAQGWSPRPPAPVKMLDDSSDEGSLSSEEVDTDTTDADEKDTMEQALDSVKMLCEIVRDKSQALEDKTEDLQKLKRKYNRLFQEHSGLLKKYRALYAKWKAVCENSVICVTPEAPETK